MRLNRFTASGIHGYLRFDIRFNESLTFLTGINGSGKTSALNSIVALITPDLLMLANLQFDRIKVDLDVDGKPLAVEAVSSPSGISLLVSTSNEPLVFSKYTPDLDQPLHRQAEAQSEHYRDVLATHSAHPVLQTIADLPTPMFLGLDRRARFDDEVSRRFRFSPRAKRSGRNVFGGSLARSLDDASELAETQYRDALIESGAIAQRLQKELLCPSSEHLAQMAT